MRYLLIAICALTLISCSSADRRVAYWENLDIPYPVERFSDLPPPSAGAKAKQERLKLAIAKKPESTENWVNLGWRLYKDGQYGECEWIMSEARKRSPNDPYVLWLSGLASYAMGHYSDAKKYLWKLWEEHKRWPDTVDMGITYDVLGRIYILKDDDLSIAGYFLRRATEEMPKNWQTYFLLGISEWFRQRYGEASDAFEKARSLNPNNPIVLQYYAQARVARDERSVYYAKKAAEEPPLYPEAANDARKAIKAYKADLAVIKKAIAADPKNPENFELLGLYYDSLDQMEKVTTAMRKAVSLDEKNASAKYNLARILLSTGIKKDKSEAKQLLLQSIALSPWYWKGNTDAPHVGLLVTILLREGKILQAQALTDWLAEQVREYK